MFYRLDQFAKFAAMLNKTYHAGQNCSCQDIPKKEATESFIKGKHRFLTTGTDTCRTNQRAGFHIIRTSVKKKLRVNK